ncbi:MAG: hypothetical protein ACD_74C00132G0004 [uncultured bacterium]|jgi:hypothetical protein|nr:MAG: hypothetical protein ACD_74C00132G0004 [uncultured bacterium]
MQQQTLFDMDRPEHLGVAYGLGVDSTAALVGMVKQGIRPDFILFADVGAEKASTYAYLPIIQDYLARNNFPLVTVVKYVPVRSPYTTMEGNMVMNATVPGACFNRASCTMKWKIQPQDRWVRDNGKLLPGQIKKMIGFEAGEEYRKLRANDKAHQAANDSKYSYWYPLIEWGWDRDECAARIIEAGLPVPPKSACIFCPNTRPEELNDMTVDELGRIVRVEVVAEPYNRKISGLWRHPRKRDNRPGSITEYLVQQGMAFTHPDDLEFMQLNEACMKAKRGFTFDAPHREGQTLADLIGGCECAKLENHFHKKIIESLPLFNAAA